MLPEMIFNPIDAKDSSSYSVVNIGHERPNNQHNASVMAKAIAEYLNSLLELQARIREKFEPQLIKNDHVPGEKEDEIDISHYDEMNSLLKEGARGLYYT